MKKGFTLMEMLAVVLILAVVSAFAVPAVRSIRSDIQARRARTALELMAGAFRQTKAKTGGVVSSGSFVPTTVEGQAVMNDTVCQDLGSTGVPPARRNGKADGSALTMSDLFACGYLNPRDFKGLPYEFRTRGCNNSWCSVEMIAQRGKYEGQEDFISLWEEEMVAMR